MFNVYQKGWQAGSRITASALSAFRQALISIMVGGRDIEIRQQGNRLSIDYVGNQPGVNFAVARLFEVLGQGDDWILCRKINPFVGDIQGAASDNDIYIAKPYCLQRTPFDGSARLYPNGQTISYSYSANDERTANDGTDSETQIMTPQYFAFEQIVAVKGVAGGTGVAHPTSGIQLVWQDINTCGRHWAVEP